MSLCLTKYHAMKIYPLLNSALHHEHILGGGGISSHTGLR